MNSSMKRTSEAAVTSLLMLRSQPQHRFKSLLLVEGQSDESFFDLLINRELCKIVVMGGKEQVIKVARSLEGRQHEIQGVLAIVDSDFDVVNKVQYNIENVFNTFVCDIESLIFHSAGLTKYLRSVVPISDKDTLTQEVDNITKEVMDLGKVIGLVRMYLKKTNKNLGIKNLKNYIDYATWQLDLSALLQDSWMRVYNAPLSPQEIQSILSKLEKFELEIGYEDHHLRRGHDLVELLQAKLNAYVTVGNVYNKENIKQRFSSVSNITMELRMCYESLHFSKTKLYFYIKHWEQNNIPFKVLP